MHSRRVQKVSVCARTIRNMTDTLKPGTLMVTPGDREDRCDHGPGSPERCAPGGPDAYRRADAGQRVIDLCRRALDTGLPVLSSDANTYETSAHMLASLSSAIPIDDPERIEESMESVACRVDTDWLQEHLKVQRQSRLSPPAFRYQLSERARSANKRIVLPEGCEPRTVHAAIICHQRKLARCVLIGNPQKSAP